MQQHGGRLKHNLEWKNQIQNINCINHFEPFHIRIQARQNSSMMLEVRMGLRIPGGGVGPQTEVIRESHARSFRGLVTLSSPRYLLHGCVHFENSSSHILKIYTLFHRCYTLEKFMLKIYSVVMMWRSQIYYCVKKKKILMLYQDVYLRGYNFQWPHHLQIQVMLYLTQKPRRCEGDA